jgi:hypothetical protein
MKIPFSSLTGRVGGRRKVRYCQWRALQQRVVQNRLAAQHKVCFVFQYGLAFETVLVGVGCGGVRTVSLEADLG